MNFYNENDPKTAAWLRELVRQKMVPDGVVDERSIELIQPYELTQYTQCHFFAGIGGWSFALKLAGWPENRPVWTGSCPCQPFSTAGRQKGSEDERHLWPSFFELIRQCRPKHVFGEQVANAVEHGWLDGVSADLETEDYACGAAVLGASCTGKPHLRKRIYWVAHTNSSFSHRKNGPRVRGEGEDSSIRCNEENQQARYRRFDELVTMGVGQRVASYSEARTILHGIPNLMALMRGAGNAIVPQVAAEFIQAFSETQNESKGFFD